MFYLLHLYLLQDLTKCRECLSTITTTVQSQLPQYLPHLEYLVQKPCHDKLSLIAADVIIMSHTHFGSSKEQVKFCLSFIIQMIQYCPPYKQALMHN